jgi:NAD(P)H-quinone oxidoreductase subunit I
VVALKELAYLPKGVMDPHGVDPSRPRAGKLPEQALESLPKPAAVTAAAPSEETP